MARTHMAHIRLDDPDLPLAVLISEWPQTIPVFMRHRMLCVGCHVSPFHTVTDVCAEYNLNEAEFLAELMAAVRLA